MFLCSWQHLPKSFGVSWWKLPSAPLLCKGKTWAGRTSTSHAHSPCPISGCSQSPVSVHVMGADRSVVLQAPAPPVLPSYGRPVFLSVTCLFECRLWSCSQLGMCLLIMHLWECSMKPIVTLHRSVLRVSALICHRDLLYFLWLRIIFSLFFQGTHYEAEVSQQFLQQLARIHLHPQLRCSEWHFLLERTRSRGEVNHVSLPLPFPSTAHL